MAIIGYLFHSRNRKTRDKCLCWMMDFGCCQFIEDDGIPERFRPKWRMLSNLKTGDEVVVSELSNALHGIRERVTFLDLCQTLNIWIMNIHIGIYSARFFFPDATPSDVFKFIGRSLSTKATSIRQSKGRLLNKKKGNPTIQEDKQQTAKEKAKIIMYGLSIDNIYRVSGFKSHTSVFHALNKNVVQINRGRH